MKQDPRAAASGFGRALRGRARSSTAQDVAVRRQEGLALYRGLARGEPPPDDLAILEHAHSFRADLLGGQKTGFYLDQRENRRIVGIHAAGRRVLNVFSSPARLRVTRSAGGAQHVTDLDSSHEALVGAELAPAAERFRSRRPGGGHRGRRLPGVAVIS